MEDNIINNTQPPVTPDEPAAAPKKKKGLKIAIIAVAIVVVIALAAGILLSSLSSSPIALVATGAENTAAALAKSDLMQLSNRLQDGGSLEISADLYTLTETLLGFGFNGQAAGKLYFSPDAFGLTGVLEMGGVPLLDATALFSEEALTVASEALLGKSAYGINLKEIKKNFNSSVFGPNGKYSLGISVDDVQEIVDSANPPGEELNTEAMELIPDFTMTVFKSLQEHSDVVKEKTAVTFNGESCNATAVKVSMNASQMVEFLSDILDYLYTNEKLKAFLTDNAAGVAALLDYYGMSADTLVDDYYDLLDEVRNELDEARKEAPSSDASAQLTFYISKEGSYLIGMESIATEDGETITISCFLGPNPGTFDEFRFTMDDGYGVYDISYSVEADSDAEYGAKLTCIVDDSTAIGTVHWEKQSGLFTAVLAGNGETFELSGNLTHSEASTSFSLDYVSANGEKMLSEYGLTFALTPGDPIPEVPEYTEVLTMSDSEIDALVQELARTLLSLLTTLN